MTSLPGYDLKLWRQRANVFLDQPLELWVHKEPRELNYDLTLLVTRRRRIRHLFSALLYRDLVIDNAYLKVEKCSLGRLHDFQREANMGKCRRSWKSCGDDAAALYKTVRVMCYIPGCKNEVEQEVYLGTINVASKGAETVKLGSLPLLGCKEHGNADESWATYRELFGLDSEQMCW